MCGIVGFNWEDEHKVRELSSLLEHRGPEQDGVFVGGGVSLGHKRLCIQDLSERAAQPLYNEDRSICITYNGEIYNFKDLRQQLEGKGHKFISDSDTEVIVHGYEQWGTGLLAMLNGQFAFCIFDKRENKLFLARDRVGIRPLYYYRQNGRFIFGSELKVFLKSGIDKEIDRMAVEYYMLMGNAPDSCSILKGVEKLQPGCYMVYDLGERKVSRIEPYWELSFIEDNNTNFEEIKRQVREKVEESVIRRLICDVPFGAFLSGGLDSSIIVAVMSKHVKELKTFSISFDYPDFNESQYSRLVSEKFNTRHFEIPFRAEDIKQLIPELPYYYDEPFADPSMIATSLVCSVARKHVTVSLSGTGGDELFGGYARYSEFAVLKALNNMKKMLKWPLRIGNKTAIFLLKSDKLSKLDFFLGQKEPGHIIYLKLLSYMFRDRGESQKDLSRLNYFAEYFKYDDQLANLLNCDIHNYLPSCLLVKEDRAAMAVSLEARVPFLDHELVELAGRVPSKYKINGTDKKYILKKAFEDVLPKEILSRKKMGFGVPLVHYFRRELKDYAYSEIFEFDGYDYYSKDYLMELWQRHQHRRNDYSRIFWSIIMFNQWYRRWMSGL